MAGSNNISQIAVHYGPKSVTAASTLSRSPVLLSLYRRAITVGLVPAEYPMTTQVGADPQSYGYRGDTGKAFGGSRISADYAGGFGEGDVIGCGYDTSQQDVFFTCNGAALGEWRGGGERATNYERLPHCGAGLYALSAIYYPGVQVHVLLRIHMLSNTIVFTPPPPPPQPPPSAA